MLDTALMMSPATMRMVMPFTSYCDEASAHESSGFAGDFPLSLSDNLQMHSMNAPSFGSPISRVGYKSNEFTKLQDYSTMFEHTVLSPQSSPSLCDSEEYARESHDYFENPSEIFGAALKRSSSEPMIDSQLRTPIRKRGNPLSLSLQTATPASAAFNSASRVSSVSLSRHMDSASLEMAGMITPVSAGNTPNYYHQSYLNQLPGKAPISPPTLRLSPGFVESNAHLSTPPSSAGPAYGGESTKSKGNPFYCPPSYMRSESVPNVVLHKPTSVSAARPTNVAAAAAAAAAAASVGSLEEARIYASPVSRVHKDSAGANSDKPHVCEECSKRFKRMEHLRRHAKIHTLERPYQCDVEGCKRFFSRNDNLKAHMKTHAKRTGRNIFVADLQVEESNKRSFEDDFENVKRARHD